MNNTAYQNPGGLSNSIGFNIRNSSNNTIINNNAYSNTLYGFYLFFYSSNNKLSGNDAYDNDESGFYIAGASNNNNLTNNSASGNPHGFTINQSSYNILSDNIGWNNSDGFYVVDSSGGRNILRNNTARDNNFDGIFVHNSQTNVFSGNIVCNNSRYGFYINSSSYSNLTDNIVCNNTMGQAFITYSNTHMHIYNNIFNASTGQGVVTDDNGTNYWNTTKDCSRTNIIGGKCVGGNWYSDYSGVDYNNDSIGDDPPNYTIPGLGSVDYLPLTSNYTPICYMPAGAGVCDVLLSNCSCIEEALNNNSCSEVRLTVNITDWAGTCVNNPENFSNKILDCQGHVIDGSGSEYGIYLSGKENNTIRNCIISGFSDGFLLNSSPNNTLTNNSAYSNLYGFGLSSSPNNTLTNNSAYSNSFGFYLYSSPNNTLTNNSAHDNSEDGFVLDSSSNNTLTNNTAYSNSQFGFLLSSSSNNTLTNNTAYSNSYYGFYLSSSSNNILSNNSAYNNSYYGFYLYSNSNYNTLTDNSAYNNSQYGIYIDLSDATNITNAHLFKNTYGDFYITTDGTPRTVYLSNVTFDNPAGNYENYTILSIDDTVEANTAYRINWTQNSSALPTNYISFANKFVDITNISGSVSIDSISWSWLDSELSGYNESKFELWKYNSSGWSMLNNTPDTVNNRLSLTNMNPASTYGILQQIENCPVITSSGVYTQTQNYVGAPNSASPLSDYVCVKIASSNVVFDCNGYNITNNGTAGITYGILLNGSLTNVTIRNCNVGNYTYGICVYSSSNNNLTNNSAYNNSQHGFYLDSSSYNNLTYNNASRNDVGFYIENSPYNNFTRNIADSNGGEGFLIYYSNNNNLIENDAYGNSWGFYTYHSNKSLFFNNNGNNNAFGFVMDSSSYINATSNNASSNSDSGFLTTNYCYYNNFVNNIASENSNHGFQLQNTHYSNFTNNTANYNTYGFKVVSSGANIFINNTAHNNTQEGFGFYGSSYNTLINNSAFNNVGVATGDGFVFYGTSDNNIVINNYAYNNLRRCFYIDLSNGNNLTNNIAYGCRVAVRMSTSSSNVLINNTLHDAEFGIYMDISSSMNDILSNRIYNNSASGVEVVLSSDSNEIVGNEIYNNSQYQIYLGSSNYNLIYNNIFNASAGQGVVYDDGANYWNTTKNCSGTNIIGGDCIGGNFYSNYSGVDINGDGIGDIPPNYSIYGGSNFDYLPLTNNYSPNTPPVVNLLSPADGYSTTNTTIRFEFNATDDYSTTLSCSLYINGTLNQTNSSVQNNTNTTFTQTFAVGTYNWSINCTDGYNSTMSEGRILNITLPPNTPPTITLISPSNGYTSYSTTVTHVFRAVDDYSATLNCSLWINGSINQTNESVANNTNTNFVVTYALGNYVWWVNCSDGSMTNVSETRNLSVRQRPSGGGGGGGGEHDLYISPIDHQYAKIGETKNVLIIVENTGDYTETNVKLTLVCPASFSCGNATLGSIGEGKEKNATISIKGNIVGDYTLKAEARSDDAYAYREFYFTVQPECERNSDCANDEKCSNGVCIELSCGEGYTIKDHSCVKITPEEENVSENITRVFNLTMVEEAGNVGGEFVLLVLMDGKTAEGIPVVVEFPNGLSNIFYSDENGYVHILADQSGEYTFYIKEYPSIKVSGQAKAAQRPPSISVKPSTTEQPKPEGQPKAGIDPMLMIIVGLLLLFIIILAWYFLRRRGER